MKKTTLLLLVFLLSYATFAQTSGFNYKALIIDNGTALNAQSVTLKFTVLENGTTAIYQETQTATTDANGIVSVNIGEGTVLSGTFSAIDWGSNPQFLKVEIDTGSGFADFGTSEFKTVPYAKYADKAGNAFSGNFVDLNGVPTGLADGDDDTHLTDAQIATMGYIKDANDADHSTTNELQTISKNASNVVTLSDGGGSFTDDVLTETQVDNYVANNGYLQLDPTDNISINIINNNTSSLPTGINIDMNSSNTTKSGVNILFEGTAPDTGISRGFAFRDEMTTNQNLTGLYHYFAGTSTSTSSSRYGVFNIFSPTSNYEGSLYGVSNKINSNQDGRHYGTYNYLNGTGTGKKYGTHNVIENTAGGTHYAVYGDAQKAGSYAGYFLGKVSIKDGTQGVGKIFTSDANGNGSWETPTDNDTQLTETQVDNYVANNGFAKKLNDLIDAKSDISSVFLGSQTGTLDDGLNVNVGVGFSAISNNTTGMFNIAIGSHALESNISGSSNTIVGYEALKSNKANNGSVAIGYKAMYYADNRTTGRGTNNTAVGYESLKGSTTEANNIGRYNTALGYQSLFANTSGNLNIANGYRALYSNTTGIENTANGSGALYSNTTGNKNTANGKNALFSNTTGNENTANGYKAGYQNTTGSGNLFLGNKAGYNETGSNKLYIDNSDTATPLIYGDFNSDELTVNANSLKINNVGGEARLFINAAGTNLPSTQYYLDDTYKTSSGYNINHDAFFIYHGANVFFNNGNILPTGHKTHDLGANGNAWDDVYADNYVNQGAAAFTDRNVSEEIINHPPIAKKDGDFDARTKDGLYELNPDALPTALRTTNGIKIDEIATYNYKANYEQQVQINEQQKQIDLLKKQLEAQQKLIDQLLKQKQN